MADNCHPLPLPLPNGTQLGSPPHTSSPNPRNPSPRTDVGKGALGVFKARTFFFPQECQFWEVLHWWDTSLIAGLGTGKKGLSGILEHWAVHQTPGKGWGPQHVTSLWWPLAAIVTCGSGEEQKWWLLPGYLLCSRCPRTLDQIITTTLWGGYSYPTLYMLKPRLSEVMQKEGYGAERSGGWTPTALARNQLYHHQPCDPEQITQTFWVSVSSSVWWGW